MSEWNLFDEDDDDGDQSELKEKSPYYGRDGIIFLIDCRKDMFTNDIQFDDKDDGELECGFSVGLRCCKDMMLYKIKQSQNALISVVFFGVKNGNSTRKNIHEYQSLLLSRADIIKRIDSIRLSDSYDDFENKYGHSDNASLADVLSACQFQFGKCTQKLGFKRIILFTKDYNPDCGSPDGQHKIRTRVKDLAEADVDLQVIAMGADFNKEVFFDEIVKNKDDSIFSVCENPSFSCLIDTIIKDSHTKRTIARLMLKIGGDLSIGVGLYRFTRKQQYLKKTFLSRNNEEVKSTVNYLNEETGAVLRPYQLGKAVNVGSEEVTFSNEEFSKLRKGFSPGITLLGFKPKDAMKLPYLCGPPYFMFPDESSVKGSSQLFKALLLKCIERDVVGVCALTPRVGSRPKYVLAVPQEEIYENSKQLSPEGFLLHTLPFSRMLPEELPKVNNMENPKFTDIFTRLVKKIKLSTFELDYFENPSLEKIWMNIEAYALDQETHQMKEEFVDTTLEHFNRLDKRLKEIAADFNEVYIADVGTGSTKRTSSTSSGIPAKIPKMSEIVDLAGQGNIEKLTVPQLKHLLKSIPGIHFASSAKKSDLVQLVYSNMELIKKYVV